MRLVQLLLTDEQAEIAAAALTDAHDALAEERADKGDIEVTSEQVAVNERLTADIAAVGRLQLLFQDASENPLKYKPSPKNAVVRSIVKAVKVPVPQSRRKRRAGRHQRRKAERMLFRRNREYIENFNRGREQYEKDEAEYQAALTEINERIEGQPKFEIRDGFGNTIMAGIPAEFILDAEGISLDAAKGKIVLPPAAPE